MGGGTQTGFREKSLLEKLRDSPEANLVPTIGFALAGTGLLLDKILGSGAFEWLLGNNQLTNIADYIGIGLNYIASGGFYLVYDSEKREERKTNFPIHH